jgi:hypothetical protein
MEVEYLKEEDKLYINLDDIPAQPIKPHQEAILDIFCKNSHFLGSIKLTPFCSMNFQITCKLCGNIATGNDVGMSLSQHDH